MKKNLIYVEMNSARQKDLVIRVTQYCAFHLFIDVHINDISVVQLILN